MKNIIIIMGLFISSTSVYAGAQIMTPQLVGCFPNGTCFVGVSPDAVTTCGNKNQVRFDITLPGASGKKGTDLFIGIN